MTLVLLEVAGRMSFGQQVVQSKDGDSPAFQATAHTFQLLLAMAGAFLILCLSHPAAQAFKVPQFTWIFALLAIAPLARGLEHLDYYRKQRELQYLPAVLCDLAPQVITTVAAWPLAIWLKDFRAIVYLTIGKAVLTILMTHLLADRRYSWGWRRDYATGMWLFGWPLLLNGLLMFSSQQADQLVIGKLFSLSAVAGYALAWSIVSIPWFIFGQVGSSIMLPILSRAQDDSLRFRLRYRTCAEYAGTGAVVLTLPLMLAGEQLVTLLYGAKYAGSGLLTGLLAAASAVRFLRFVPAIAATAQADTLNHLYSNICRGLSLPAAAAAALLGGTVIHVAACALAAEVAATLVSAFRLRRRQGVPLRDGAGAALYVFGFVTLELTLVCAGTARLSYWGAAALVFAMLGLSVLVACLAFPALGQRVLEVAKRGVSPVVRQFALD
jgi:O-antigen/teichoic acid export membrane protein